MISRQKLIKSLSLGIESLPEYKLQEVLDFVNFLLLQENKFQFTVRDETKTAKSNNDTLAKFIGGVSHGSLARKIDEELYGV